MIADSKYLKPGVAGQFCLGKRVCRVGWVGFAKSVRGEMPYFD